MHARPEQLLAKRDGEPLEAAVAAHIDSCGRCLDALARLEATRRELRSLPELTPPEGIWPNVAAGVAARNRYRRPALAAAAIVAVTTLVALAAVSGLRSDRPGPQQAVVVPAPQQQADDLVVLAGRSAAMERELRQLRQVAPAVVRVGHQLGRAQVEARLRALDYGLYRSGEVGEADSVRQAYWNERVRLLDSMLQMERAELINQDLAGYRVVPVGLTQ